MSDTEERERNYCEVCGRRIKSVPGRVISFEERYGMHVCVGPKEANLQELRKILASEKERIIDLEHSICNLEEEIRQEKERWA